MDRKEAIKIIKDCKEKSFKRTLYTVNEYHEAVDIAIKALEQEPTALFEQVRWERDVAISQLHELGYKFGEKIEQQPCEDEELDFVQPHKKIKVNLVPCGDAISRQAAIDAMATWD